MGILAWIVMGLIVGAIAKMIMGQGGGWLSSLLLGIAGAVVGGWIGDILPLGPNAGRMEFFSLWSWLLAIVGACVVIWVYRLVTRRRA
nr:GlsB/YeaQ/YmgE family stress response membrane protein [Propionibacterium sp.]